MMKNVQIKVNYQFLYSGSKSFWLRKGWWNIGNKPNNILENDIIDANKKMHRFDLNKIPFDLNKEPNDEECEDY